MKNQTVKLWTGIGMATLIAGCGTLGGEGGAGGEHYAGQLARVGPRWRGG